MDTVIEIGILRDFMHPDPSNRPVVFDTVTDNGKMFAVACDEFVTVHASLGWRYRGHGSYLDTRMAVPAVHFQFPGMKSVTKRDRLHRLVSYISKLRRKVVPQRQDLNQTDYGDPNPHIDRYPVRPRRKNLCHLRFASSDKTNEIQFPWEVDELD